MYIQVDSCYDFNPQHLILNSFIFLGYLKYTEQINNVTSVIDASAIYGSDDKRAKMLRSYEGGLMKLSSDNYLPIEKPNAPETHDCSLPFHGSSDRRCFAAGI